MRVLGKGEGGRPAGKPGVQIPDPQTSPALSRKKTKPDPTRAPRQDLVWGAT